MKNTRIIGSGSYIPSSEQCNAHFLEHEFYNKERGKDLRPKDRTVQNFEKLTGIASRRVVNEANSASDMAAFASKIAIESAGLEQNSLDYLLVAHNWGDISEGTVLPDLLPNLAARVKRKLGIENPRCVAFDILMGCPGWLEAFIQAHILIQSGQAKRILVVGTDTVTRIADPHDIDFMLFGDGAGAVILEGQSNGRGGVLAHLSASFCGEDTEYLKMGASNNPNIGNSPCFMKMQGRKVAEFALSNIPPLVLECLEKAGIPLENVKKFLFHQANGKLLESLLRRIFESKGQAANLEKLLPLTVGELGNSSVATIPTLYDLISKEALPGHAFQKDDILVFVAVGAGMHINCLVYKI